MARGSGTLAVLLGIVLGATWTVAVRAEGPEGGATAAPKAGSAAAKSGKGSVAKGGTGATKRAKGAGAPKRAKTTSPAEAVSGPEVRNFQAFCDEWMQKLRDRETYNTSHIAWATHEGRVSGEYVGYDTKCTCIAHEEPGKDPIGKIMYRETRYRREGTNEAEALVAPGTVLEQSDVTEIFRFGKGRWQY
jgi:hypothetical protein